MKAASQVVCYLASFAVVFILGNFFDIAFWQAGFHAKRHLTGQPLPRITQFLVDNHHLPAHLVLLPWVALVGVPLFTLSGAKNYWDVSAFVVRYLAFFTCELLFFLVLTLALALPYIPYYAVLEAPRQSGSELAAQLFFWGFASVLLCAGLYQACRIHRTRRAAKG